MSRDPLRKAELRQRPNLYWYIKNNAPNALDPTGQVCCPKDMQDTGKAYKQCIANADTSYANIVKSETAGYDFTINKLKEARQHEEDYIVMPAYIYLINYANKQTDPGTKEQLILGAEQAKQTTEDIFDTAEQLGETAARTILQTDILVAKLARKDAYQRCCDIAKGACPEFQC